MYVPVEVVSGCMECCAPFVLSDAHLHASNVHIDPNIIGLVVAIPLYQSVMKSAKDIAYVLSRGFG